MRFVNPLLLRNRAACRKDNFILILFYFTFLKDTGLRRVKFPGVEESVGYFFSPQCRNIQRNTFQNFGNKL